MEHVPVQGDAEYDQAAPGTDVQPGPYGVSSSEPFVPLAPRGSKLSRLFRAGLFGGFAAILGGIVWHLVMVVTDYEFGLLAIAVGMGVGKAVSVGSYEIGGRGYQFIAGAWAWMGACFAYIPFAAEGAIAEGATPIVGWVVATLLSPVIPLLAVAEEPSGLMGLVIIGLGVFYAAKVNAPAPHVHAIDEVG